MFKQFNEERKRMRNEGLVRCQVPALKSAGGGKGMGRIIKGDRGLFQSQQQATYVRSYIPFMVYLILIDSIQYPPCPIVRW